MQQFYTWHYSPVDNINQLNELGIRYIVVLYDDLYYQQTQPYFEKQEIVYENDAGCILTYSGASWATSYKKRLELLQSWRKNVLLVYTTVCFIIRYFWLFLNKKLLSMDKICYDMVW